MAEDPYCRDCPDWIRTQCVPQSPGAGPVREERAGLAQLQQQLTGK